MPEFHFRIVADYFVQMRKYGTYNGSGNDVRHMREVLQLLSVLTDDTRFLQTIDTAKEGDAPKNMSEVLDRIEKRGIEQGIEKGIEQGIERGIEQGIERGIEQGNINRAKRDAYRMKIKGLSIEDIADVVEQDISTVSLWIQSMSAGAE